MIKRIWNILKFDFTKIILGALLLYWAVPIYLKNYYPSPEKAILGIILAISICSGVYLLASGLRDCKSRTLKENKREDKERELKLREMKRQVRKVKGRRKE